MLHLLPDRAVWHQPDRTLAIADVHLGKAPALRAHGLAVPGDGLAEDLPRLSALITRWRPARMVLLGDLVHAREGWSAEAVEALAAWRAAHEGTDMILVAGNHDRRSLPLLARAGFTLAGARWSAGPLACVHDPARALGGVPTLAGHWHPVVKMAAGPERLRVPCFWLRGACLVLPAFGSSTGGQEVRREPGDRIFLAAHPRVLEVPAPRRRLMSG